MNSIIYIFRFLFRIKYWLIICPLLAVGIVYLTTRNSSHTYEVKTTVYTGVASGYDIESSEGVQHDWNIINNAMDNLINIITAQTTLKNVSMRLFAQHMMYGDPNKDNTYISAAHYRNLLSKTPPDVVALIDKTSEERTLQNLYNYEKASRSNHVYGLFNWTHPYYSYEALSKIKVIRKGNSDMLEISYGNNDPGVVFNTLVLLNEEFVKQYKTLRFGETNNVIQYFEEQLALMGQKLRNAEDSLRDYNVEMRVINYDKQTEHVSALTRDFELRYENILLDNNSADRLIRSLEERIDEHTKNLKNNTLFINKMNEISDLTTRIATVTSFSADSTRAEISTRELRQQLTKAEEELTDLTTRLGQMTYTKEGIATQAIVNEWLAAMIRYEKTKAELDVMKLRKQELDEMYVYYSPIGTTIKRKEREINFNEQSYLSILSSLNTARLRKKNLEMSSATLKIINPPTFPIAAMPSKNKLKAAAAGFGTLLFIIGWFILLELIDRTLKDRTRTERITGGKVLGALPAPGRFRYRSYDKACRQIAGQYMGNAVLGFLRPGSRNIINILSTNKSDGKSFLADLLTGYLTGIGLNVRLVTYGKDFNIESKEYLLAASLADFAGAGEADVVIVEHPPLSQCTVPKALLDQAQVNLFVVRADRVWKDADQLLFAQAVRQSGDTPVLFCLNRARRDVVESFAGMLPPYTRLKKLVYRLSQFGFTSAG
ncbi:MAG: exopolysaccharide biosynthesis protein [Rikenellaceae bacterium]|nr:exopolysaccharide biosynthesis protein [Rikenellaceae bacterium]